jgi:hypothetical protein
MLKKVKRLKVELKGLLPNHQAQKAHPSQLPSALVLFYLSEELEPLTG